MVTTLVGIFDDYHIAQQVAQEFVERGFNQADINITANEAKQGSTHYGGGRVKCCGKKLAHPC